MVTKKLVMVVAMIALSACTVTPPPNNNPHDEIEQALQTGIANNNQVLANKASGLPSSLNNALIPDVTLNLPNNTGTTEKEKRFDVTVNAVPAQAFFMGLVKGTDYNMVVNPSVGGSITLDLKNVTIPEVLNAVRDSYGYEYEKTAYGYRILPREMETRIFSVDYLNMQRKGKSSTLVSSGEITQTIQGSSSNASGTVTSSGNQQSQIKPSSSVESDSDTDFWKTLQENLKTLIGDKDGHSVVVNPQAGVVIVRAFPDELRQIAKYLDNIQNIMQRQVILEAKILEVQLSAQYKAGIDWTLLGLQQTGNVTFGDNFDLGDFAKIFSLNASARGAFSTVINLLNSQGKVHVLSSPRIATTNNQKAVIKVGEDEFFVTNIENTTTTGTATTENQNIDLTPFFSGISLDVTPQIDEDDNVILHIHPIISKVVEDDKKFTVSGLEQDLPLAKSTVRESDSIVHAKNGQVIVIGGLMESAGRDYKAQTPGASNMPGVGGLFKSNQNEAGKLELVILLKPTVTNPREWNKKLSQVAREFRDTNQDFSYDINFKKKNKTEHAALQNIK